MGNEVLFGRDVEQARLTGLLEVLSAQGGTIVLRGEAGVGKSALVAATASEATRRGMRVLSTTGVQAEVHVPYGGLHRLLPRVLDEGPATAADTVRGAISDVGATATQPFLIALAVLELVVAASSDQPLVLVVDDAQWLDRPSWEALAFVGRRLESDPVALLMAMRDGEEANLRLSGAALPELRVAALTEEPAAALLDHRAPALTPVLRARVLSEAGGNPLGLVELGAVAGRLGAVALLPDWLPLTTRVEQTFAALATELPAATRSMLLVAALDDGDLLGEIIAATAVVQGEPVTEEDVAPAVAAGLLAVDPSFHVTFRHPLMRSALRQSSSISQRRQVHAALAGVLGAHDDRQVWHRAAATIGVDEGVARDLAHAATRARRRGAVATSVMALERAADLSPLSTDRASRLLSAAFAAADSGDIPNAIRLAGLIEQKDLPPLELVRLSWMREIIMGGGWSGAARLPAFVDMAEQMRLDGDGELAMDSLVNISLRCYWSNPDEQTRQAIVEVALRLSASDLDPRLVNMLALVAPIERGADALDRLARLPLTRAEENPNDLLMLGFAAGAVGALGPSTLYLGASVVWLRGQGRLGDLAQALVCQSWTAAQLADTRLALTAAAEARALALETGQASWVFIADLMRAQVEALRGDSAAATALADAGEGMLMPAGANPRLALVQVVRGIDALANGRNGDAYDHLSRIFDPIDAAHHPSICLSVVGHLAEAVIHCGRQEEFRPLLTRLETLEALTRSPVLRIGVAYARAVLASDDEADEAFLTALGADLSGWAFERARLQLAYGSWLRRQRRASDSRSFLREAAATFDAMGVTPWADRSRRELRASGETSRRPVDARNLLTPQELQIAQLAAEGLSNRDIGERLFLSPRTISTHLYRIYPKIGVSSRQEIAKVIAQPMSTEDIDGGPAGGGDGPDYVR